MLSLQLQGLNILPFSLQHQTFLLAVLADMVNEFFWWEQYNRLASVTEDYANNTVTVELVFNRGPETVTLKKVNSCGTVDRHINHYWQTTRTDQSNTYCCNTYCVQLPHFPASVLHSRFFFSPRWLVLAIPVRTGRSDMTSCYAKHSLASYITANA